MTYIMMHISRCPQSIKLLHHPPQSPYHIRQPASQHGLGLGLIFPKIRPTLRAPMLMPRRAARRCMLKLEWMGAQMLPDAC